MEIYRQEPKGDTRGFKSSSPGTKTLKNVTKKIQNYYFRLDDILGKGSFSTVYRGVEEQTQEVVAVKVIELNRIQSPTLLELLYSQIEILKSMRHPNILQCYEVFFSANNCYIITEYCNEGDVKSLISREGALGEKVASKIVLGVFDGLKYLAREHIVHRDLKTANVFMKNGKPKIADFGFAKRTRDSFKDINIGSPVCMSPEGIIQNVYGPKTDVWAFGIFLYELFHGYNLFRFCRNEDQLKEAVLRQVQTQNLYQGLSSNLKDLVVSCLQVSQEGRVSIEDLQFDPYLRRLNQSAKSSNILVSQVEEYMANNYDSMVSTEAPMITERKTFLGNKSFTYSSDENNRTCRLRMEAKDNNRTDKYVDHPKISSFDFRVKSPKETHKLLKPQLGTLNSEMRDHVIQNTRGQVPLRHRNSMILNDRKFPLSLKKDPRNTNSTIFNYKSASTFQRKQKADRSNPSAMQFEDLLALLHYCRMLYKTIKEVSSYIHDNTECLSSWLFFILTRIKSNITMPEPSVQFKKLKEILSDYSAKYKKELSTHSSSQVDYEKMQRVLVQAISDLQYRKEREDKDKDKVVTAISYSKFLLGLNEMLNVAIAKESFEEFTERNGIEEFLSNKQEQKYKPRKTLSQFLH